MFSINVEDITSSNEFNQQDFYYSLFPNPFAVETSLSIFIETKGHYQISIFGLTGKMIKTVFAGNLDQGSHSFTISQEHLPEGINFCRILNDKNQKAQVKLLFFRK